MKIKMKDWQTKLIIMGVVLIMKIGSLLLLAWGAYHVILFMAKKIAEVV